VSTGSLNDCLTRIRNAQSAKHRRVLIKKTTLTLQVSKILQDEGFIECFFDCFPFLELKLKSFTLSMHSLTQISRPGQKCYTPQRSKKLLGGLGTAILSTSQGLKTDRQARRLQIGGEILFFVW